MPVALITGASSGFGQMIARELAHAGCTSYASMRDTAGKNAARVEENARYAREQNVDLRSIELDVQDVGSVRAAASSIGPVDVLVQNAGHMVYGPSEAFTPEQLAQLYDVNVLGAQRVMRAVLPAMRSLSRGLIVWISSSSVAGGVPPLLGPYFAAKAAMDALAVSYAKELAPLGIDSSIVVPGAFTSGTNHFVHAGAPADAEVTRAYHDAYAPQFSERLLEALAATVPAEADPTSVARAVTAIVRSPKRPLRVVIDPASDGSEVSFAVIDRVRSEFVHRIGLDQLHAKT